MIKDMQLRRFSHNTQDLYVRVVLGLAKHYKQSPDTISDEKIQDYLLYLMGERKFAWSTCDTYVAALRFFFGVTLDRQSTNLSIPPRKTTKRLPQILAAEELGPLFASTSNLKHRALLMTTYSAGLRVSEVVRLKITDIDSKRMMIRVEQGKRNKDRYTILSRRLLEKLRTYWKIDRPPYWLFPGQFTHMNVRSVQAIIKRAGKKIGVKCHPHMLRHSFATHLIDNNTDVAQLQHLLGHQSSETTMMYVHMSPKKIKIKSPLDV